MNEYNKLKDDINKINTDINLLRKDIDKLKLSYYNSFYNNNNQILNDSSDDNMENKLIPEKVKINNYLSIDSYTKFRLDNTFTVFKSIDEILYLIYSNVRNCIISYNLIDNKKIIEIKNAHHQSITNFRHYLDEICKRDLMISISCKDNNIKLWNIQSWECLLNIEKINLDGDLDSACFLRNDNEIYIITSNEKDKDYLTDNIKVFDIKGNKIREINDSKEDIYFIDTYYDKQLSKNYIITGNYSFIKSFDFNLNKIYYIYCDEGQFIHRSIIINSSEEKVIKLIESSDYGNIRIWNFHTGLLLNKFQICGSKLYSVCLWNNNYLFVGCQDCTIKLIELKTGKIILNLIGHNSDVITIKKIIHPIYGECLLSQNFKESSIKLWTIQNF